MPACDTYLFGRGSGQDSINNYDTSTGKVDVLQLAPDVQAADVRVTRFNDNLVLAIAGTGDAVTITNYFYSDANGAFRLEEIRFADGTTWDVATVKQLAMQGSEGNDWLKGYSGNEQINGLDGADTIYGDSGNDTLDGGAGNDYVYGDAGDDTLLGGADKDWLYGGTGNDALNGGAGDDVLRGDAGNDVLEGSDGNDNLHDTAGNGLYNGGVGTDSLTGGLGNELFIGGTGNDAIVTGAGNDIIAFNRGDGQDTVDTNGGGSKTLSLGGALDYDALALRKSANDLVVDTGNNEQLTLKNWYAAGSARAITRLQVISDAMVAYDADSGNALTNRSIQQFNFTALVAMFDQARVQDATLNSWKMMNSLLDAHLAASDSEALGGDLAYQYGHTGALSGIGLTHAQAQISSAQFASQTQSLQPENVLRQGELKLG